VYKRIYIVNVIKFKMMEKLKKVKRLYLLKEATVKKIEEMAEKESRNLSTIIDLAIKSVYEEKQN